MLSALLPLLPPIAMRLASVIHEVVECKLVQVSHQTVVASHHIAMPVRKKDQSKSNPGDNSSDIYYSEQTSLLWENKRERTLQMPNELRCHSQSTKQLHWDWSAVIKRELIDVGGAVPLIYWKEGTTGWCYFRHITIGLLLWAAGNLLELGSKQPQTLPQTVTTEQTERVKRQLSQQGVIYTHPECFDVRGERTLVIMFYY